ncbi:MAG: EAL domain-containing protein [Selenomonas sp.]|jgi:EAL domain-containing protein (putative c-di-GMP-specific phosphodiesterase class I)|nr:EAL domain-containing protein [Selenomonas sp.]
MTRQDPWFLLYGLSPEVNYILALCRIPDGLTPQKTAELLLREAGTAIVNGTPTTFSYHIGIYPVPKTGSLTASVLIDNAQAGPQQDSRNRSAHRLLQHRNARQRPSAAQDGTTHGKGLQQEEFKVYLQAKYDIQSQSVCAAEALVRWDSPELGFLMPGKFIDLFERNGFAIQLDYYMLEHICRMQRERLEHGKIVIPISVNQSALHITEEGYLDTMESIAEKYQLPAGLVELELTETAFIDYTTKSERNNTRHIVQSLKQMGFSMSIDDFCTGYSSIAMLQTIPANVMKIDRTMLLAAETSDRSLTILRHMVELGHNLNMKVVVEGIETRKQELLLLSIGCNTGQGFLFAKPMPHQAFRNFVEEHG